MKQLDVYDPAIAVFRAFARTVAQGTDAFVVLDTAPTGHTLFLLDATEAYHRGISRKASDLPGEVRELLPRLPDPLLVVRGADELPYVHEVAEKFSRRTAIVPWVAEEPVGPEKLRQLFSTNHSQPKAN